jgi:peptide/nickel transport system substrate-binding protein
MHLNDLTGTRTRRQVLKGGLAGGAAVALPGLLSACGGDDGGGDGTPATSGNAAQDTPTPGGTLRLAISGGGNNETLDPALITTPPDQGRALNVYDRLTRTKNDMSIENVIAESVEGNADATRWQVKLKDGITFHDGKPLTAGDVLHTLRRIGLDKEQPFVSSLDMFDLKAAKAVDDLTLDLPLVRPYGDMPRLFSSRFLGIVPEGTDKIETVEQVNGSGPFTLDSFTPGERTVMRKNESYFMDGQPFVDEVQLISIDKEGQMNALLGGQVDGTEPLDVAVAKQQEGNSAIKIVTMPLQDIPNMTMRLDSKPFDDPRVREAFKLALDREKMVQTIFLGEGQPGNDLFGPAYPSYNKDLPQREYDPERAKALLAEAGHPDGVTVELVTALFVPAATAYAEAAKAAGINIRLKRVSQDDIYNTDLYYLKAPFSETSWGGDSFEFIAPQALLQDAPFNETGWQRPDFDKRLRTAIGTVDEAERIQLYKELQEELWNEGGYLIWGFGDALYGASSNVGGLVSRPGFTYNDFTFRELWLRS